MANKELSSMLMTKDVKNSFLKFALDNLWACRKDPRFSYYVYIPEDILEEDSELHYQVLVVIHGTTRVIEDARYDYREFADKNHFAIVAPLFPAGVIVPDEMNGYKALREGEVCYDELLLTMLDELHEKFPNIDVDKFYMAGHSGGGQYVQRFMYLHPERLNAVSISAPGRPTYLNKEEDFFWGIRNFEEIFGKAVDTEALKNIRVQVMVGELDVKFLSESPYGTNRMERNKALYENYLENGIDTSFAIVQGVGHFDGDQARSRQNIIYFQSILDKK